jgi:hypothetical protein
MAADVGGAMQEESLARYSTNHCIGQLGQTLDPDLDEGQG